MVWLDPCKDTENLSVRKRTQVFLSIIYTLYIVILPYIYLRDSGLLSPDLLLPSCNIRTALITRACSMEHKSQRTF